MRAACQTLQRVPSRSLTPLGRSQVVKSQMVDANALVEGITFRICRYIEASLPLRVVKMAAEFVLDDYGQAWVYPHLRAPHRPEGGSLGCCEWQHEEPGQPARPGPAH